MDNKKMDEDMVRLIQRRENLKEEQIKRIFRSCFHMLSLKNIYSPLKRDTVGNHSLYNPRF